MLRYYASRLKTVEINNTFYRLPRRSVLEGWAGEVGPDFRFVLKASRRITHFKKLSPEALDATQYLIDNCAVLGDALGVILMQLPPNMPADTARLATYLDGVPDGVRMAFEFRHGSWFRDQTFDDVAEILRQHGHALCFADASDAPTVPTVATSDWGYLRLRRSDYEQADLDYWAQIVRDSGWSEAFVFFKHEDAGAGPRLAESFADRF